MIKSITIENYKKFKESVKLDFWNHKAKKVGDDFIINDSISSVVGILGKNASGKSTLIEAILFYNNLINNAYLNQIVEKAYYSKIDHLYQKHYDKSSSRDKFFKMIKNMEEMTKNFLAKKIPIPEAIKSEVDYLIKRKYDERANDNDKPISLTIQFYGETKKEITHKIKFFEKRILEIILIGKKEIYNKENPIYLFESQFNFKMNKKNIENIVIKRISNHHNYESDEISLEIKYCIKKDQHLFQSFLKTVDDSIKDFVFDGKGKPTSYITADNDKRLELNSLSKGTLFFISLYRYIYKALFEKKSLILIDEIENSLHFSLIKFIITVFKKRYNKMNSQLLFTTHNPHIFDRNFKSNSIYFIDKNNLVQNQERYDKNIAPSYLNGELGSNPNFHYRFQFLDDILSSNEKDN